MIATDILDWLASNPGKAVNIRRVDGGFKVSICNQSNGLGNASVTLDDAAIGQVVAIMNALDD